MRYLFFNIFAIISLIGMIIFWGIIFGIIFFGGKINDFNFIGLINLIKKLLNR